MNLKKVKNWTFVHKNLVTYTLAAILLTTMFLIAFFSSRGGILGDPGDSATMDEVAHIPSGYTYVKDLDYRLNPEHPPIAKVLSGLSLMFYKNIKGPEANQSWNAVDQWGSGWHMLYSAGNNPEMILKFARFPIMILMVLTGIFLFFWSKKLFGRKVALIILALYSFYPDIIAHGRLVTTDVAAAFGYILAIYFFNQSLQSKSAKNTVWAGVFFAVAQLLKFSAILLFIIFFIFIIVKALLDSEKRNQFWSRFWPNFKTYLRVCVISLVTVWLVYLPLTWNTPGNIEHIVIENNVTLSEHPVVVFKNFLHRFENNHFTRPIEHYMVGVSQVIGRVSGGNETYIVGQLSDKTIRWFFPIAWLLKTPIPVIILALFSVAMLFIRKTKSKEEKWLLTIILTPLAVYWSATLAGSLNLGIRHLMPTIPFVLLLIGYTIKPLLSSPKKIIYEIIILILIAYTAISTVINFPSYISYFNELTPKDARYTRMIDSSLDWGQDMLRLKKYLEDNRITDVKVDYFGGSSVNYYLPYATVWHSEYGPTSGWLAVSNTFYQSSKLVGKNKGKWSYQWLEGYKPVTIVGNSILVYYISEADLLKNPPFSPYPIKIQPSQDQQINQKIGI